MKKLISVIPLFISLNAICQDIIKISGKVIDAETNEPLAFATVSILGTSNGAVSNFSGEFEFGFSSTFVNDTLYVSMLGYRPYKEVVNRIKSKKGLIISLMERVVLLDEIEIIDKTPLTAKEIVKKAKKNLRVNYSSTPYVLDGFSRVHKKECGEFKSLYEATFELHSKGYQRGNADYISLKETRYSQPLDYFHCLRLRMKRNLVQSLLSGDNVLKSHMALRLTENNYEIENYTVIDDQLVYVIKGTDSDSTGVQKELSWAKGNTYHLYITAKDFAILRLDRVVIPSPQGSKRWSSDSTSHNLTQFSRTLRFEKNGDKYYPKYINWSKQGKLFHNLTNKEFCNWGFLVEIIVEDVHDEVETKPSKNDQMDPNKPEEYQLKPYNNDFWENYALIKEFPVNPQIVQDLSKHADLELQFEKSYEEMEVYKQKEQQ